MKTKVHQRYYQKDGTHVPGSTTILGMLDKPALLNWAWELGMKGEDYRKVRDNAANIGTIAHYLIECHLTGETADLTDYSPANVEKAENAVIAYFDFEKAHGLKNIFSEKQLVSEKYLYGGTIDCYAELDGKPSLLDFKTSKGVFPEMKVQVASYANLLVEHGYPVESVHILQINKETGEFVHHRMGDLTEEWELFKILAQAYPVKQKIWKK